MGIELNRIELMYVNYENRYDAILNGNAEHDNNAQLLLLHCTLIRLIDCRWMRCFSIANFHTEISLHFAYIPKSIYANKM